MYAFGLIFAAVLIISIFSTNWPIKFYHHWQLKKLGNHFGADPVKHGLLFSGVYSELKFPHQGKNITIRFLEGSADSLFANSGLEVRVSTISPAVIQFFRGNYRKGEWGDFKQFRTGDQDLDSHWFILTNDLNQAQKYWEKSKFSKLLVNKNLEQVLLNESEVVLKFHRLLNPDQLQELLEWV